jgi:hypothetical protein
MTGMDAESVDHVRGQDPPVMQALEQHREPAYTENDSHLRVAG